MFEQFKSNSGTGRYGKKALAGAALAGVLAGFLVFSGVGGRAPAVATAGPTPMVQSGTDAPVMASPFAALAQKLGGTVVNVKVDKVEKTASPFSGMPDPFRDFFGNNMQPRERAVQGAGSGVIISSDGTILTNNHVVEGAREVSVTLSDKHEYKAKVLGRDPKTDLAILKIDAGKNLPAAPLGDSDSLQVGDWVMAVGNPFGLGQTVTSGIVSAKGRVIGAGPYDDFIQTDASINPGNSGGPLFNMKGEIVGINTAIIADARGIGFAIPVNTARPLIPQLETKGEVTRGYLGVNIQSVTPELAAAHETSGLDRSAGRGSGTRGPRGQGGNPARGRHRGLQREEGPGQPRPEHSRRRHTGGQGIVRDGGSGRKGKGTVREDRQGKLQRGDR